MQNSQVKVIKIPAYRQRISNNIQLNMNKKKVCAYCRVSTEDECQVSSFDLQVDYYTKLIKSNTNWDFAGVYSDYGKSGTSTNKRNEIKQMIDDCKQGKIDLIITKSISRFARNTLDCLGYMRELKSLDPPVGIYFEKEKLDTLDPKNELLLTILSSLAQEESRSISENLKWSIQKSFQAGKARCPTQFLIGYDKDEYGNMVINEAEAMIIRRIFREYMEGKGLRLIANELKAEGVPSGRGGSNWGKSSIMHILKNERYCGDVLMQKNITVDFLTHKQIENKGQLPKYFIENHHPAIISKDEWNTVQNEIIRRFEITTKDPILRQGYSNISVMSNRLFCGECGQPLIRHTTTLTSKGKKEKITVFRCRATSSKSRKKAGCEPCYARRMQERKLEEAFMQMLIQLKTSGIVLGQTERDKALMKSINEIKEGDNFNGMLFVELVEKAIVYDDGKIEYTLKNGLSSKANIQFDRKNNRRKSKTNSE